MKPSSVSSGILARPLVRGALVVCGLVVLSLAGRFAVAGGRASPVTTGGVAVPTSIATAAEVTALVVADASPPTPPQAHATRATDDDPVYLNEATVDDLRRLPGIGEKRALAILELRRKLGRFKQIEDLLRVKGIGRSTLRRLRPLVRVDHPAQPAGDGGAP